ncbi:hypothetical protein L914_10117, partial [Phytophthora nicotianae]
IWTMQNYSMADLAVPKSDVSFVDCTYLNCSQPNEEIAHYAQYCTGWKMLSVSRCVTDDFEYLGADTYLGMMWSIGGDPNMTPPIRPRDHTWTKDIAEYVATSPSPSTWCTQCHMSLIGPGTSALLTMDLDH